MWYVIQVQCRHEAETAEMCQARAARDGEKLVVTDDPLKGYEGRIKWVNAHRKIAAIEIEILGQKVVVKLGIEFLKKVRGEPEK